MSEALERSSRRLLEQSGSPVGKSQVQEGGMPGLQLTEQELQEYAMMLENNAVSEIMHWAVGLKSANPARSELFGRIARLARSADLAALKALLI